MNESSNASFPEEQPLSGDPLSQGQPQQAEEYNAALKRVAQALEGQQPSTETEKALYVVGLSLSLILFTAQLIEWLSYPYWLELLYSFFIFAEATLPLAVSFFLKNKQQATILRVVGTIILLIYALSLF